MPYPIKALLLSFLLIPNVLSAQADLVLSQTSFEPTVANPGDILTVNATVTNVGNVTAAENYLFIYYSQDTNIEPAEIVSRVSVRALAPGESQEVIFFYPTSPAFQPGGYLVAIRIDPFNNVPESDEVNLFCVSQSEECALLSITDFTAPAQRQNLPMIYIHGLNSDSDTWNDFLIEAQQELGWSYGGRLDYCLNPDNNQSTSDGYFLPFINEENLALGDFYVLNFDVNAFGETFVSTDGIAFNNFLSDQSAIVKQGLAVGDAIDRVLALTGADEVILVGHSMGGLAAREYLQHPENWQPDGRHHVAKVLTIGTPHGGSNAGVGPFSQIGGFDERSEAVRDLRYNSILFSGQYLDGGVESSFSIFQNDDVDCNGQTGDLIVGINEMISPPDVDYSCVIGNAGGLGTDGVVDADRADFNNYLFAPPPLLNQHADRYEVPSNHLVIHTENFQTLLRALDEPDFYELAYSLPLERLQFAHVSEQAENHPIPPPGDNVDWDDFRIDVPVGGLVDVRVWNIPVHTFGAFIVDQNGTPLVEAQSNGDSQLQLSANLPAGSYFIEFGGIPTAQSWRFPYAHYVSVTPAEPVTAAFTSNTVRGCAPLSVSFANEGNGSPTAYAWSFSGGTPTTSSQPNPSVVYPDAGSYSVSLIVTNETSSDTITQTAYVDVLTTAVPAFSREGSDNLTVTFNNETIFSGPTPSYTWDFGDGETSNNPSPTHTFPASESYTVTLTVVNECGSTSATQTVDLTTVATMGLATDLSLNLSPNPAETEVVLRMDGPLVGQIDATVVNQIGQAVIRTVIYKNSREEEWVININDLASGAYYLKLTIGTSTRSVPFVKR